MAVPFINIPLHFHVSALPWSWVCHPNYQLNKENARGDEKSREVWKINTIDRDNTTLKGLVMADESGDRLSVSHFWSPERTE